MRRVRRAASGVIFVDMAHHVAARSGSTRRASSASPSGSSTSPVVTICRKRARTRHDRTNSVGYGAAVARGGWAGRRSRISPHEPRPEEERRSVLAADRHEFGSPRPPTRPAGRRRGRGRNGVAAPNRRAGGRAPRHAPAPGPLHCLRPGRGVSRRHRRPGSGLTRTGLRRPGSWRRRPSRRRPRCSCALSGCHENHAGSVPEGCDATTWGPAGRVLHGPLWSSTLAGAMRPPSPPPGPPAAAPGIEHRVRRHLRHLRRGPGRPGRDRHFLGHPARPRRAGGVVTPPAEQGRVQRW